MVIELNRTLDQELLALMRGASLECPACGEFVLQTPAGIACPECGSSCLKAAEAKVQLGLQAG
jgi:predicted RNA-binding Zn-ribbon protein involved in translation (DUF1610 family)